MSSWTHIKGIITVAPPGRTQAEKRYILETVLAHLPIVSGSEGNMNVHIVQKSGYDEYCSCDEFGEMTDKCIDSHVLGFRVQNIYNLVLDADLRDRDFNTTYREFIKWLTRLAKRISVSDVFVKVSEDYGKKTVIDDPWTFYDMYVYPSLGKRGKEPNWCEYLMWREPRTKDDLPCNGKSDYPDGGFSK